MSSSLSSPSQHFEISPQDVADFQRDGAVCLRQLHRINEIAQLREGIEANLKEPSPRARIANPARRSEPLC